MGEREEYIATGKKTSAPRENYSHFMEGGSNVDGDESGGTSSSRQGAGTGILVPLSLLAMAAEIGITSGKSTSILGVSTPRAKYRRRGCRGDPPGSQEASWRGLGWGCARYPPGSLVVAPVTPRVSRYSNHLQ